MPGIAAYLHGVEFISDPNGFQVARVRRSSVIGLVGTAPIQLVDEAIRPGVNVLSQIASQAEGRSKFGPEVAGYTIPQALRAIALQGAPYVLVVNTFDPDNPRHYETVTDEARTFDDNNRLVAGQIGIYEVTLTNAAGDVEYTLNLDYSYDGASGEFIRLPSGRIDPLESILIDYRYGVPLGVRTAVVDETVTFSDAAPTQIVANTPPIQDVTVTSTDGNTFYIENIDYSIAYETGSITRLADGDIPTGDGVEVLVDYTYGNPIGVTDEEIMGAELGGSLRTGCYELLAGFPKFSYNPRILIAPGYTYKPKVQTVLVAIANRVLGHVGIDGPLGITRDEAISGRNGIGPARNFIGASYRQVNLWPHVISATSEKVEPYSQFWAGVFSATQSSKGYWWSPSNQGIVGINGTEVDITSSHTDQNADVQLLNAVGVVTVYGATAISSFATAYKTWGNRSAAYPATSDPKNFICIQVVEDQIRTALELALLPYIDRPINGITIGLITQTIDSFLARLITTGALIDGRSLFLEADNLVSDIANGEITVRLEYAAPPPLERLVVRARYNEDFLAQLGGRTLGQAAVGVSSRL